MQTRRKFLAHSVAAIAAMTFTPSLISSASAKGKSRSKDGKPMAKIGGLRLGIITYSWRSMPGGLENLIKYCKEANVANLELMGNDLEAALGAPVDPTARLRQEAMAARPDGKGPVVLSKEQQAEIAKYHKDLKSWRMNLDFSKVEALRKRLQDEGIDVHIVKTQPSRYKTEEEIDYAFNLAKAMGVKGVTDEMSLDAAKRIAPYAEKHGMYYILHNHMQYAQPGFSADPILAVSPKIMLNFDQGHYYGSTGLNPVDFVKKYHERIFSIHLKDKTGPKTAEPNANQVWGQGETPLEQLLTYVRDHEPQIYCDIELEYTIKPWSNAVKEVATCVKYARQILE